MTSQDILNVENPENRITESNSFHGSREMSKATEEQETCRICRGEGTKNETLFYPCKCSGSIKFVHQDCLMEWLSHSQKKHCELCKTPFRFTKLYHPQMPSTIPTTVFLRRATLHTVKNFLIWCRAILVVFVWVFFLPLAIRWAWRSLFWFADGDWARKNEPISTGQVAISSSHGDSSPTSSSSDSTTSTSSPFSWLTFGMGINRGSIDTTSATNPTSHPLVNISSSGLVDNLDSSLLSGFSFLRNLTPLPMFNKSVMDVLEGQIITLCVVVAFILVFLIREWVIQQQPVNQMAALDEAQPEAPTAEENQLNGLQPTPDTSQDEQVSPTEENVEALILKLQTGLSKDEAANENENEVIGESSNAQRLEDRRYATRMVLIHSMLSAFEERTKDAINRRDLEALSNLQGALRRFKDSVDLLPERYHADLRAAMNATEIVIHTALTHLNQIAVDAQDQIGDQNNHSEQNFGDTSMRDPIPTPPSSLRMRPSMPTRSESSLATEIQRSLEDKAAIPRNELSSNPELNRESSDAQLTEGSNHSSESWQQVPENWEVEADIMPNIEEESSSNTLNDTVVQPMTRDVTPIVNRQNISVTDEAISLQEETQVTSTQITELGFISAQQANLENANSAGISTNEHTPDDRDADTDLNEQAELLENNEIALEDNPAGALPFLVFVLNWIWGDEIPEEPAEPNGRNDAHIVRDLQEEAPFVPFLNARPEERDGQNGENLIQEPDVAAAVAAHAGNNQDEPGADADAEDLEGIMELIGMQGPLVGLFQNAIFSAVLIFATLSSFIWLPYIWGKVVLLFVANPISLAIKIPVHLVTITANLAVDFSLFFAAMLIHWIELLLRLALKPMSLLVRSLPRSVPPSQVGKMSGKLADAALLRMVQVFAAAGNQADSEYFHMSVNSHVALRSLQTELYACLLFVGKLFRDVYDTFVDPRAAITLRGTIYAIYWKAALPVVYQLRTLLLQTSTAFISVFQETTQTGRAEEKIESILLDSNLVLWNATDRFIAILVGYGFFALVGTFYLNRGSPISTSLRGRRFEAALTEFLQQAGGVLKVILIISIEMIVFPLYCGILLDTAMLPLFEHATFLSRLDFSIRSPWTSVFVHWFVGTCYMFHFALFVSMCRKIMRTGVLYFIRDPDDPTFHPIRDVLERPVTSQLRKIAFSGLVYGALVIICLGSVVWTLNLACSGFLPVHWTSGEPVLGFPIDLLMYNFLMPLVLRSTKPSKGLHKMYGWWFRKCARQLRLSHFLFGEQKDDEEGVTAKNGNGFVRTGKYVRVPFSDQVRIPKDQDVFLEVDQDNNRLDGKKDQENGIHGRKDPHFIKVYIPDYFLIRIALFVVCLWALTAILGLVLTVLPLVLGRQLSAFFTDSNEPVNDIHAFAIGVYIFGGSVHLASKYLGTLRSLAISVGPAFSVPNVDEIRNFAKLSVCTLKRYAMYALRIIYTYSALAFVFPSLFALLIQFYVIMPLHTYLQTISYGTSIAGTSASSELTTVSVTSAATTPHSINFLQDWTLGLLYLHIAIRLISQQETSRPARALRAVVQEGYLRPNIRLATRCFILPAILLSFAALFVPAPLGWLAGRILTSSITGSDHGGAASAVRVLAYRYAYPAVLSVGLAIWAGFALAKATSRWRLRIRDEVYLIGERLHNFGEKKPPKLPSDEEAKLRLRRQAL